MIFQSWDPNCKPITSPGQEEPVVSQNKGGSKPRDWLHVLGEYEAEAGKAELACWVLVFYEGHHQCQGMAHVQKSNPKYGHRAQHATVQAAAAIFQIFDIVRNLTMASFYKFRFRFLPSSQPPCCSMELQFFHHMRISVPGMISFSMMRYNLFLKLFAFHICQV